MNKAVIVVPLAVSVAFLVFPFLVFYGNHMMVVTSDSMLPTLKPYDLIVVEQTSIEDIKVGDIVVFDTHIEGLGIVAHRAVEIFTSNGEIGIDTKGDNTDSRDPWVVHDEDLIGKVVETLPKMGVFLIEPVRYAIVAVIIITAISLAADLYKDQKKQQSSTKI